MAGSPRISLPNHARWPNETLSALCSTVSRGSAPRYVERSLVMAIGQRCVAASGFEPSAARPHAESVTAGTLCPEAGDVLLNSTGTGTIGRSAVFDGRGRFIVDGHVTLLRPRLTKAHGRWLNSVLQTWWGQNFLETQCYSGSTNQVELSRTRLADAELPTPPLLEQRRIAEVLDTLDEAIGKTEQLIAKLKQVKRGLLHDLLTRGIDDNDEVRDPSRHPEQFKDSPLGRIPREWSSKRLRELSPRLAGRLIVQPHQYFADDGVPIVFASNIRPGWIDLEGIKHINFSADARFSHCRIRAGDLLTVRVGVPGMTAVVPAGLDGCHFASTMWIRQADSFSSEWLCACMNSSLVRSQIESANYGSVQTQFNIREAEYFLFPVPPKQEQLAIVERLQAFDGQLNAEASTLNKLLPLKLGIMTDLLTGRVRVPSLPSEVAA